LGKGLIKNLNGFMWLSPVKCGAVDVFDVVRCSPYVEVFEASEKITLSLPILHGFGLWEVATPESPSVRTSPRNNVNRHTLFNLDRFGLFRRHSKQCRMCGE
jgi:hypothetical protein